MISLMVLEDEKEKVASWRQSLIGAGTGAVTGGAVGASRSENKLEGGLAGAGIGALGGAGIGALSSKISKGSLEKLKNEVDLAGKRKKLEEIYRTRGPASARIYGEEVVEPAIERAKSGVKDIERAELAGSIAGGGLIGGGGGAAASLLSPKKRPISRAEDPDDSDVLPSEFRKLSCDSLRSYESVKLLRKVAMKPETPEDFKNREEFKQFLKNTGVIALGTGAGLGAYGLTRVALEKAFGPKGKWPNKIGPGKLRALSSMAPMVLGAGSLYGYSRMRDKDRELREEARRKAPE